MKPKRRQVHGNIPARPPSSRRSWYAHRRGLSWPAEFQRSGRRTSEPRHSHAFDAGYRTTNDRRELAGLSAGGIRRASIFAKARDAKKFAYCAQNLHIVPVFGPNALAVSPRIGHVHVRVDDASWVWADASGLPIILQGLLPGPHKVLIELVDANHHTSTKAWSHLSF